MYWARAEEEMAQRAGMEIYQGRPSGGVHSKVGFKMGSLVYEVITYLQQSFFGEELIAKVFI